MIKAEWLKPCNGYHIDKSWEVDENTGKIKKDSIVYTVYDDPEGGFIDCFKTLKAAQEFCKSN